MPRDRADVVIVGAGAAGLMAACWARRTDPARRVVVLDSAPKLGAKILISGGGRCNVTHHRVDATAFAGSSRHAIGKVLRSFDVSATVGFFAELGVDLKREATGKLFPTTDRARTVLDALLDAVQRAGVELLHPRRVESITAGPGGFLVCGPWGEVEASRVILASGGRSIPKSGSDGHGYHLARQLGHTVTRTFPALVPLSLPADHFLTELSGLATPAELAVTSATGKRLVAVGGPVLCTHFGLSGPAVLDVSRYLDEARQNDPACQLRVNWLPGTTRASLEEDWKQMGDRSMMSGLRDRLPARLARALCHQAGVDGNMVAREVPRESRRALAGRVSDEILLITGNRGFNFAEVTAGGIPLAEVRLATMESRRCPDLYLCGEICDVDGRIGGFNFQWAWSSGYVAGLGVTR